MELENLKQSLTRIKESDFTFGKEETFEGYAEIFLEHIGVTDSYLRDNLIYEIFAEWIEREKFTTEQLRKYLSVCLDDQHLMYRIGENGTDSVYTRTFSALIVACILDRHLQSQCLTKEMVLATYEAIVTYYRQEEDLRGYTREHGWAHSAAHGADMIALIAACEEIGEKELWQLLVVIQEKICQSEYVFIDREPNRVAKATVEIFKRGEVSQENMVAWIQSLKNNVEETDSVEFFHQRVNIDNFIACLYFKMKLSFENEEILSMLETHSLNSCIR